MRANFDDYRKLFATKRIQLVADMWDNIAAGKPDSFRLSEPQKAELRRRVEAHRAEPSAGIRWEQIRGKLLQHRS